MKSLEKFKSFEISLDESKKIQGGSWFYEMAKLLNTYLNGSVSDAMAGWQNEA